jgi:hypothetical protein
MEMRRKKKSIGAVAAAVLAFTLAVAPASTVLASSGQDGTLSLPPGGDQGAYKLQTSAVQTSGSTWSVNLSVNGDLSALSSTDVVILVDSSEEMKGGLTGTSYSGMSKMKFTKIALQNYAHKLLSNEILNARLAIVSYNKTAKVVSGLSKNEAEIGKGIESISEGEGSNMQAALKAGQEILKGSKAVNRVIFLISAAEPKYCFKYNADRIECATENGKHAIKTPTANIFEGVDYGSTISPDVYVCPHGYTYNPALLAAEQQAQTLREDGAIIYTMGFTANPDTVASLLKISTKTANEFHNVGQTPKIEEIEKVFDAAIASFAQRAILGGMLYIEIPMAPEFDLSTSDIIASQGSTLIKAENRSIGWIPGDIHGTAIIRFTVKLRAIAQLDQDLPAFAKSAYIKHTDSHDSVVSRTIEPPMIHPKSGSITMYALYVDEDGKIVDKSGKPIALKEALNASEPIKYKSGGSDILPVPGEYTVTAPKKDGYDCKMLIVTSTYGYTGTPQEGESVNVALTKESSTASVYLGYRKIGSGSSTGGGGSIGGGNESGSETGGKDGGESGSGSSAGSGSESPDTGDSTMPFVWGGIALAMALSAFAIAIKRHLSLQGRQ